MQLEEYMLGEGSIWCMANTSGVDIAVTSSFSKFWLALLFNGMSDLAPCAVGAYQKIILHLNRELNFTESKYVHSR